MQGLSRRRFMNVDRTRLPVQERIRSRGVPNALQDHPVVDTLDLAIATEVTSQLLGPCQVTPDTRRTPDFHCRMNAVQLLDVKPFGKKQMRAADWARGVAVPEGARFG